MENIQDADIQIDENNIHAKKQRKKIIIGIIVFVGVLLIIAGIIGWYMLEQWFIDFLGPDPDMYINNIIGD